MPPLSSPPALITAISPSLTPPPATNSLTNNSGDPSTPSPPHSPTWVSVKVTSSFSSLPTPSISLLSVSPSCPSALSSPPPILSIHLVKLLNRLLIPNLFMLSLLNNSFPKSPKHHLHFQSFSWTPTTTTTTHHHLQQQQQHWMK